MSSEAYLSDESRVFTLIWEAGANEHPEKTRQVIEAVERGVIGVDCRYFASSGDTPLHWAAVLNNVELARFLIGKGADVNVRQAKYLVTPLHAAARRGHSDMCRLLLDSGADVTAQERHFKTPGEFVNHSRCKAHHALADDVKQRLGWKPDTGAYKEPEPNLKFWGKLGPPPKYSKAEEEQYQREQKKLLDDMRKANLKAQADKKAKVAANRQK